MKEGFQPVHTSSDIEQVQQILLRNQRRKIAIPHPLLPQQEFSRTCPACEYVKNPLMTLLKNKRMKQSIQVACPSESEIMN